MKNFYKILLAFLLVFCLGFLITYITISTTLAHNTTELHISEIPHLMLQKTSQVG